MALDEYEIAIADLVEKLLPLLGDIAVRQKALEIIQVIVINNTALQKVGAGNAKAPEEGNMLINLLIKLAEMKGVKDNLNIALLKQIADVSLLQVVGHESSPIPDMPVPVSVYINISVWRNVLAKLQATLMQKNEVSSSVCDLIKTLYAKSTTVHHDKGGKNFVIEFLASIDVNIKSNSIRMFLNSQLTNTYVFSDLKKGKSKK